MKILNELPKFPYGNNTRYYVPAKNVLQNGGIIGLTKDQIQEGDEIHIAASHSVGAKMRRNRREGDVAIICTATSGFGYCFAAYQPLQMLEENFKNSHKIILWLYENVDALTSLEKFGEKEVQKDRRSFGYHEMEGFLPFPIKKYWDSSTINPPHTIRYARRGILSEDCAWYANGVLTVLEKGQEIEFAVN